MFHVQRGALMLTVKKGNRVKVEYEGKLEDGTIFDASKNHGAPLEFEVGAGQMISGFDEAVLGMKISEEKAVVLPPDKAYGNVNPLLIKNVPRTELPQNQQIERGMVLGVALPNGQQIPARIVNTSVQDITIDFNHPLAGKILKFKIKVVAIKD